MFGERGRIQKELAATGLPVGKDIFAFSVRSFTFHSHILARIVRVGGVGHTWMCLRLGRRLVQ
jgi:hypothetical protein